MSLSSKLPRGIRRLFRLPASYERRMRDLDEEIRFHVDAHVARLRADGMSESDAQTAALERFGDAEDLRSYCGAIAARRERTRRLARWIDELAQDAHYAVRQIARAPGFTATAALILALGVGANTGIFSIVHHLLLAPLPFADGNRIVTLISTDRGGRLLVDPPAPLRAAWRARAGTVEQIMFVRNSRFTLGDSTRGSTEMVSGAAIPPQTAAFLGEKPLIGRFILPTDTMADAPPVALIGEALWRRSFGAANDVVGQRILLNGTQHTVIGVVSSRFVMPFIGARDAFVPLQRAGDAPQVLAKLRGAASINDANREMARMFPAKSELNPFDDPPHLARELDLVGDSQRQMLLTLFGAVGVILLIACANVANLLLARSLTRQREFAVRIALGAGRARIVRQVLTESTLLAAIAGVLGIGIAHFVLEGIGTIVPGAVTDVRLEGAVFLWSAALSLFTGLLFGIAPALNAADANVGESLKIGGPTSAGSSMARRVRVGLVVAEMALSVVLLAGAGLLVRTLIALDRVDVGFQSRGLASVELRLGAKSFPDATARRAALLGVLDGVQAIPGVRAATLASASPPSFAIGTFSLSVEARATAGDSLKTVGVNSVGPDFFAFTGTPLQQGRTFTPASTAGDSLDGGEMIINETLARKFWPNGGAVGARMRRGNGPWGTVVGIVGDVRLPGDDGFASMNKDLQLYLPARSGPERVTLMLRSDLPPNALGPAITKAVREVNAAIRTLPLRTADEAIASASRTQRAVLELIGAFAVLAIVLAGVGLHAVIAYSVNQRTREIGVRVALGAQSADVARLIVRQGVGLAVAGAAIGMIFAAGATRVLRSYLYGVKPGDPLTLAAVAALLIGIALIATYAPARRAARLDPLVALRAD